LGAGCKSRQRSDLCFREMFRSLHAYFAQCRSLSMQQGRYKECEKSCEEERHPANPHTHILAEIHLGARSPARLSEAGAYSTVTDFARFRG
jgi:hypothetical protein